MVNLAPCYLAYRNKRCLDFYSQHSTITAAIGAPMAMSLARLPAAWGKTTINSGV